jgi:hypothetical protein
MGALPPAPRHLSLWANGMNIEATEPSDALRPGSAFARCSPDRIMGETIRLRRRPRTTMLLA